MAVKPIEKMPDQDVNERMEQLKRDIWTIIDKSIIACEIEDPPYPPSTMRERFNRAVRAVVWECRKEYGTVHAPRADDVFRIASRKIDGVVHWYVQFDASLWKEEWERILTAEGKQV